MAPVKVNSQVCHALPPDLRLRSRRSFTTRLGMRLPVSTDPKHGDVARFAWPELVEMLP